MKKGSFTRSAGSAVELFGPRGTNGKRTFGSQNGRICILPEESALGLVKRF